MKKISELYLIIILAFATSCTSDKPVKEGLAYIDATKNYPEKEIFLNDIADITYLYLNSDDDDYLYQGSLNCITENTIVVYDNSSGSILFFTRDGQPKSRFNRRGQGPEEYNMFFGIIYDEAADDVFVNRRGDMMVYSSTGVYKRTLSLPPGAFADARTVDFDEHSLFIYDTNREGKRMISAEADFSEEDNETPFYLISKTDGEVLDYVEIPYVPLSLRINVDGRRIGHLYFTRLLKCSEGILLSSAETDTIFLYSHTKSLMPVLYKTPSVNSTNPMKYLNNCLDRGQYQFIEVVTVREGDESPVIFPITHYMRNKYTGEVLRPTFLLPDYKGKEFIINPTGIGRIYNDGYYFELDLIELKQAYRENRLSGKLEELVAKLNEDEDNNVFMLLNFFKQAEH